MSSSNSATPSSLYSKWRRKKKEVVPSEKKRFERLIDTLFDSSSASSVASGSPPLSPNSADMVQKEGDLSHISDANAGAIEVGTKKPSVGVADLDDSIKGNHQGGSVFGEARTMGIHDPSRILARGGYVVAGAGSAGLGLSLNMRNAGMKAVNAQRAVAAMKKVAGMAGKSGVKMGGEKGGDSTHMSEDTTAVMDESEVAAGGVDRTPVRGGVEKRGGDVVEEEEKELEGIDGILADVESVISSIEKEKYGSEEEEEDKNGEMRDGGRQEREGESHIEVGGTTPQQGGDMHVAGERTGEGREEEEEEEEVNDGGAYASLPGSGTHPPPTWGFDRHEEEERRTSTPLSGIAETGRPNGGERQHLEVEDGEVVEVVEESAAGRPSVPTIPSLDFSRVQSEGGEDGGVPAATRNFYADDNSSTSSFDGMVDKEEVARMRMLYRMGLVSTHFSDDDARSLARDEAQKLVNLLNSDTHARARLHEAGTRPDGARWTKSEEEGEEGESETEESESRSEDVTSEVDRVSEATGVERRRAEARRDTAFVDDGSGDTVKAGRVVVGEDPTGDDEVWERESMLSSGDGSARRGSVQSDESVQDERRTRGVIGSMLTRAAMVGRRVSNSTAVLILMRFFSLCGAILLFLLPVHPVLMVLCALAISIPWGMSIGAVIFAYPHLFFNSRTSPTSLRRWDTMRTLAFPFVRQVLAYFPLRVYRTVQLDPRKKYLFAYHPHGVYVFGLLSMVFPELSGWRDLFPGVKPVFVGVANSLLCLPLVGDVCSWWGLVPASKQTLHHLAQRGDNIALVPGGIAEMLAQPPSKEKKEVLFLKKRRGFIRLAIEHQRSIVPVYGFGENDTFKRFSFFSGLRMTLSRWMRVTLQPFRGRYFTLIPFQRPLDVVVGKPIDPPKVNSADEITTKMVEDLHAEYMAAVKGLFDDYKHAFGMEDVTLILK